MRDTLSKAAYHNRKRGKETRIKVKNAFFVITEHLVRGKASCPKLIKAARLYNK
jgi:hypothetical protein